MTTVLAIGQSNLACVSQAAHLLQKESRLPPSLRMSFLQLLHQQYKPHLSAGSDGGLNAVLRQDLETEVKNADVVISCLGGNAHSVFGLLNHPRPYDFVFDGGDTLIDGLEVIPRNLVRKALQEQMRSSLTLFSVLRGAIDQPMVHCESPAPIPSESHIRANPKLFAKNINRQGVAPATFRLKLWKLQSEIYREFCAANDISFLPAPTETLDENGFLSSKAWGLDPTHGNSWYGERVIFQLADYVTRKRNRGVA
jgi:hypothetical protein